MRIIPHLPEDMSQFQFSRRFGTRYGKPGFPEDVDSYDLADYIGPDSPGLFYMLQVDPSFLAHPAHSWPKLDSYKKAHKAVKSLKCVNDPAERGCKLAGDFNDSAEKEDRYQNVLKVAQNDRDIVPNQRKYHSRVLQ